MIIFVQLPTDSHFDGNIYSFIKRRVFSSMGERKNKQIKELKRLKSNGEKRSKVHREIHSRKGNIQGE